MKSPRPYCLLLLLLLAGFTSGVRNPDGSPPAAGSTGDDAARLADRARVLLAEEAYDDARLVLAKALPLLEKSGTPEDRLEAVLDYAECCYQVSRKAELGDLLRRLENDPSLARLRSCRSGLQLIKATHLMLGGDNAAAGRLLDDCIAGYEVLGVTRRLALAQARRGLVFYNLGDLASSIARMKRALELFEKAGDKRGINRVRGYLGAEYDDLGIPQSAVDVLTAARETSRREGWRMQYLQQTLNLALVHKGMNDFDTAVPMLEEVDRGGADMRIPSLRLTALYGLACCWTEENAAHAIDLERQALDIARATGDSYYVVMILGHLGQLYGLTGRYDSSDLCFSGALQSVDPRDNPRKYSDINAMQAEIMERRGNVAAAERQIRRSLALLRRIAPIPADALTMYLAGYLFSRAGRLEEARDMLRAAVELVERSSRRVDEDSPLRATYLIGNAPLYANLASVYQSLDMPDSAFALLESAKGRVSRDRFSRDYIARPTVLPDSSLLALRALGRRIDAARESPGIADGERALVSLERERNRLQEKFVSVDPVLQRLVRWSIPTVAEMRARLRERDAALVEYGIVPENLVAVGMNGDTLRCVRIPLTQDSLALLVKDLTGALKPEGSSLRDPLFSTRLARRIHRLLLEPFADLMRGRKNLLIVPDGELCSLPFEMLVSDDSRCVNEYDVHHARFLVEDFDVSYALSSALFLQDEAVRERAGGGIVLLGPPPASAMHPDDRSSMRSAQGGAPPLPSLLWAEREIREISSRFPRYVSASLIGGEATKRSLSKRLPDARVIHIATHQIVDDRHPLNSRFLLAPDSAGDSSPGFLSLGDILGMRLRGDLVVLSACQTGRGGKVIFGEGYNSIARGFYLAGIPSVIMTLWPVADRQSSDLMVSFYRNLSEGQAKSAALANAKREMLRRGNRHPYFWAGYILQGNTGPIRLQDVGHGFQWYLALLLLLLIVVLGYFAFSGRRRSSGPPPPAQKG